MMKDTGLPKAFQAYILVSHQSQMGFLPLYKSVYIPLLGNKTAFTGIPICKEVALRLESLDLNIIPPMYQFCR